MEGDFDIKAVIAFVVAAKKAGESHPADVLFEFTCPNCGQEADAAVAGMNGHIHARCSHCGMNVME